MAIYKLTHCPTNTYVALPKCSRSGPKEYTRPLVFTSTKWARMSDNSDMVLRQDER